MDALESGQGRAAQRACAAAASGRGERWRCRRSGHDRAGHGRPCTECEDEAEVLVSPDRAVADAPITAAATMVRQAIVFPSKHFDRWDAVGREQTPLTFEPDGRIYGHIAGTGCYRNGDMTQCSGTPGTRTRNFRNFHVDHDPGRRPRDPHQRPDGGGEPCRRMDDEDCGGRPRLSREHIHCRRPRRCLGGRTGSPSRGRIGRSWPVGVDARPGRRRARVDRAVPDDGDERAQHPDGRPSRGYSSVAGEVT